MKDHSADREKREGANNVDSGVEEKEPTPEDEWDRFMEKVRVFVYYLQKVYVT
jgi:hypothetical protein